MLTIIFYRLKKRPWNFVCIIRKWANNSPWTKLSNLRPTTHSRKKNKKVNARRELRAGRGRGKERKRENHGGTTAAPRLGLLISILKKEFGKQILCMDIIQGRPSSSSSFSICNTMQCGNVIISACKRRTFCSLCHWPRKARARLQRGRLCVV